MSPKRGLFKGTRECLYAGKVLTNRGKCCPY